MKRSLRTLIAAAVVAAGALIGFASPAQAAECGGSTYNGAPCVVLPSGSSTVTAGASVNIVFGGFQPNETVKVELHSDPIVLNPSVPTDALGNGSVTVTIPAGTTGAHSIVITGNTSGRTFSLPVTVAASGGGTGQPTADTGSAENLLVPLAGVALLLVAGVGVAARKRVTAK
jgi:LPXTG-motif cell wall-anchored protein